MREIFYRLCLRLGFGGNGGGRPQPTQLLTETGDMLLTETGSELMTE